jgi:hypothetical protein
MEIKQGDKTIKVTVYFWTDQLEICGIVNPKAAWAYGVVVAKSNKSRDIKAVKYRHFHKLEDIPSAIRKALKDSGVTLYKPKEG